jgi:hypothetical protein
MIIYSLKKICVAAIKARKQASGSTRRTAIIRVRHGTTVLHQESRTFAHRGAALMRRRHGPPTVAELMYRAK